MCPPKGWVGRMGLHVKLEIRELKIEVGGDGRRFATLVLFFFGGDATHGRLHGSTSGGERLGIGGGRTGRSRVDAGRSEPRPYNWYS
jgi:hypothetical protein